jgi:hypothetical protein
LYSIAERSGYALLYSVISQNIGIKNKFINTKKMKKSILLLFYLALINTTNAQVGINIDNPKGVFHIDAKNNTNGSNNISDDIIVDANGNIGIGTLSPSTKLEIVSEGTNTNPISGFTLKDGNQAIGRVLTSNADGRAMWQNPGSYPVIPWEADKTGIAKLKFDPDVETSLFYNT